MHLSQQFTAERSCGTESPSPSQKIGREFKSEEKREEEAYFGGVEPDQIERVEIERRVRAIEDGPGAELSGGQAGDDDAGELGVVAAPVVASGSMEEEEERREQVELPRCSHCSHSLRFLVSVNSLFDFAGGGGSNASTVGGAGKPLFAYWFRFAFRLFIPPRRRFATRI